MVLLSEFFFQQSALSPGRVQDEEQDKLEEIARLSTSLIDLRTQKSQIMGEGYVHLQTKCDLVKKKRMEQYKQMSAALDAKERELCKKTNQLVDELVDSCDDTPFHKALLKILGNMKG